MPNLSNLTRNKFLNKISYRKYLLSLFVFISIFVLFSYVNFERQPLLSSSEKCQCINNQDEFSNPLIYNYGKFKGMCVNNCKQRSSYLLSGDLESGVLRITNLYHEDEFWTANVDVNTIIKTEVVFENFTLNLNHVSIRFIFNNPIQLQSQNLNNPIKTTYLKDNSLIFSPEAAAPVDQSYNLFDGFMGRYGILYRSYSFEYYKKLTQSLKHKIDSKILKLNSDESKKLFLLSFLKYYDTPIPNYQLLFNNCATQSIDLILETKKLLRSKGWDIWDVLDPLRGVPATNPIGTIRSLYWWKLVEQDLTLVNDEKS